jgi:hypothetical protein
MAAAVRHSTHRFVIVNHFQRMIHLSDDGCCERRAGRVGGGHFMGRNCEHTVQTHAVAGQRWGGVGQKLGALASVGSEQNAFVLDTVFTLSVKRCQQKEEFK